MKIEDACDRKKWREQIRAKIANPEKNMTIKVFYAVELFLVIYILKVNNKFYLLVKWPMLVNVFWKNFKIFLIIWWPLTNFCSCKIFLNPVSSNPTKQQLPNCLSAFDHFMGLARKGLITDSKRSDNFSPKVELSVRSKIIEVHKNFTFCGPILSLLCHTRTIRNFFSEQVCTWVSILLHIDFG